MSENIEQKKADVILVLAIMTMLFTVCIVLYSGVFDRDPKIDVNTNLQFEGGDDYLSKKLHNIIPYLETADLKYKTAYQKATTTIKEIDNDLLLTLAYKNSGSKTTYNTTELLRNINKFYGDTIFLINRSFNINNIDICEFNKDSNEYNCEKQNRNGILYQTRRNIKKGNINSDIYTLTEDVLFYTTEKKENLIYYKVYTNESYEKQIASFTSSDISRSNKPINDYLNKYSEYSNEYQSTFTKNGDEYTWKETKKIEKQTN